MRNLLFCLVTLCEFAAVPAYSQPARDKSSESTRASTADELRRRELDLREQELAIEARKAAAEEKKAKAAADTVVLEKQKMWSTAAGVVLPILLGIGTIWYTLRGIQRTTTAQFATKAAELALQGEGPGEVQQRAKLLAILFRGLLPKDFLDRVNEMDPNMVKRMVTGPPFVALLKKEIVQVLAENADKAKREQIIADYKSLYPQYKEFLNNLTTIEKEASSNVPSSPT